MTDPFETLPTPGVRATQVPRRTLLGGRYRTLDYLDGGAFGEVYIGVDTYTSASVAVKWLPNQQLLDEDTRREITSLRLLQIDGVPRLHFVGEENGRAFLVLDYVHGSPFPSPQSPVSWDELRPLAIALLRILERVHRAGLVHADLKPQNVLVTPGGDVVLLDFGISAGPALPDSDSRPAGGTLGFAAPECWRRGRRDATTDIYSLGALLHGALGGHGAPESVKSLLDRMLAFDPQRRPASATVVLEELGAPTQRSVPERCDRSSLEALFAGSELIEHIPSRAASLVFKLSDGSLANVLTLLDRWEELGKLRWVGGRAEVDRGVLDALELEALAATREDPSVEAAIAAALRARLDGRPDEAIAILSAALPRARSAQDALAEERILTAWAGFALSLESRAAISRALAEVGKARLDGGRLRDVEALLRAGESAYAGTLEACERLLEGLSPVADEELEMWRMALYTWVARKRGSEESFLEGLSSWATSPLRRARRDGWLANLRYQQTRYAEAASLHLGSIPARLAGDMRLSALRGAAGALLEVPELEAAEATALAVVEQAVQSRHSVYEAAGWQLLRLARFRLERPLEPREDLVQAILRVDAPCAARLALSEASIAWRLGEIATADRIAACSEHAFLDIKYGPGIVMARALRCVLGRSPIDVCLALAREARAAPLPETEIQVLGLLSVIHPENVGWHERIVELETRVAPGRRAIRLDVISVAEALTFSR